MSSDEETARVERLNRLCSEIDAIQCEARNASDAADAAIHRANDETHIEKTVTSRAEGTSQPDSDLSANPPDSLAGPLNRAL